MGAALKFGPRTVDVPFMVRIFDVTERMFDKLVDPDTRAELLDGVMIVHSPASMLHDDVANFLRELMNGYASRKKLGRAYGPNSLFRPGKGRRYGPDVYFLVKPRIPMPRPKVFPGIPDALVEVLSPSNRAYDLEEKRPIYQRMRIPEIWMVDPDARFIVVDHLQPTGDYETTEIHRGRVDSLMIPGFWFNVSWLWQNPPPDVTRCLRKIIEERTS